MYIGMESSQLVSEHGELKLHIVTVPWEVKLEVEVEAEVKVEARCDGEGGGEDGDEDENRSKRAYLKAVDVDTEDSEEQDQGLETIPEAAEESDNLVVKAPGPASAELPRKKTVRFSTLVSLTNVPRSLPSKLLRQESAYYRAFQDYIIQRGHLDAFVHQLPRFEALQAQRVCRREYHRNQLLGKYQLSVMPQSSILSSVASRRWPYRPCEG
ncbi:hypothetical protein BN1708_000481 [Verticillium longisporum]|uniref:Uncharacterized protein n=1 Tax=Verticillium longisporum TaxID=100787 RepID=A0A0G4LD62_VERLO|nr:hypothetical protein BN1708_000481 [Verticillium longisporum]